MDYETLFNYLSDAYHQRPHVIKTDNGFPYQQLYNGFAPYQIYPQQGSAINQPQIPNTNYIQNLILELYGVSPDQEKKEILYMRNFTINNKIYTLVIYEMDGGKYDSIFKPIMVAGKDSEVIIVPIKISDGHGCNIFDIVDIIELLVKLECCSDIRFNNPAMLMPYFLADAIVHPDGNGIYYKLLASLLADMYKYTISHLAKIDYTAFYDDLKKREKELIAKVYPGSPVFSPSYVYNYLTDDCKLFDELKKFPINIGWI